MSRNLEQGIQAIQTGNREDGARLLRIALKDEQLPVNLRAVALLWLAETNDDPNFKIECYRLANQADPGNQDVSNRLSYWLSRQLPQGGTGPIPAQGGTGGMQPVNPQYQQPGTGPMPTQGGTGGMQPVNPQYGQPAPNQQFWPQSSGGTSGMYPAQGQPQQGGTGPLNPQYGQQPTGNTTGVFPVQQGATGPLPVQYGQQPATGGTTGTYPVTPQPGINYGSDTGRYAAAPAIFLEHAQRSVGILDGPNGRGTGIFITREGMVATTRYVIGGETTVHVELLDGRVIGGRVVRAFPEFDLAFIQTDVRLAHLLSVVQTPTIPENATLVAVAHNGQGLRSAKRTTQHQTAPHWIATIINHLHDAGGDPIFTGAQNQLVGILTKNAMRSNGYLFGLHINKIYQCYEQYSQELQRIAGQAGYCNSCGNLSRAPSFGGYYCEHCGNTLPHAVDLTRFPQPQLVGLYGENAHRACPKCQSQAGFYQGTCLRCGYEL